MVGLVCKKIGCPGAKNPVGWFYILPLFFFFLSCAAILAVQIAKRIPWKDDGVMTKSWWCFLYLIIPAVVCFGSAKIALRATFSRSALSDVQTPESDRAHLQTLRSSAGKSFVSLASLPILSIVLIVIGTILDHKESLTLTEKRILGATECLLVASFLSIFFAFVVCMVRLREAENVATVGLTSSVPSSPEPVNQPNSPGPSLV
ncbi:lipoprotein, putative [Neorickettsia risticii str. Illinois]|uniref:Lipoprotein, putative n=1 Tax=Neorickettsia risticii (strain Illinois) TaxID=434131 RepID=C6V3V2_NEORI|nr:hypothetical protein [Neorickettsia risticii]ACT69071.1 lipoprotein, putative [Neorickettsia risticii str. Illinois]